MPTVVQTTDVFTPGRSPKLTYNPREGQDVEGEIRRFLMAAGYALVISGPTKSGKTVLVERILRQDEAVWINGSDIRVMDDLWDRVVDQLGLYTDLQVTSTEESSGSMGVSGTLGVPKVASVTGTLGAGDRDSVATARSTVRSKSHVAIEALRILKTPVVIDDFHYVHEDLRQQLTRTVKALIKDVPVVLIAVPQDAFNAVREETEMVGRVWQLEIKPWAAEELIFISRTGFAALNLGDRDDALGAEFARNSLGAPFLMQQLCLEYCLDEGITQTVAIRRQALPPTNLESFYGKVARRHVPGVFSLLRQGPRTKGTARVARRLKDGQVTDIYGAILYTVARLGPTRQVGLPALSRKMAEFFEEVPRTSNITSALGHMKSIAEENRRGSDPALAFKDDQLYIADPFLSFYLRFGGWELPQLPDDAI